MPHPSPLPDELGNSYFSSPKEYFEFIKGLIALFWRGLRWFYDNPETVIVGWIVIWTSVLSFVFFNNDFASALMLFTSGVMNMTSIVGLAVPALALSNIFFQQTLSMLQSGVKVAFKKALDDIRNFFKKVEDELKKVGRDIQDFFKKIGRFFTGQELDFEMLQLSYEMLALRLDPLGSISPESAPTIAAMKKTAARIMKQAKAAHDERELLGSSPSAAAANADVVQQLQQKLTMQFELLSQSLTV